MKTPHKKFMVLQYYGDVDGWHIENEAEEWEEAILQREQEMYAGDGEVIITEYCPIIHLDGREKHHAECRV